jgi:hypothetical protein
MPDENDGITMMRARMTRARRVPPSARRATPEAAGDPATVLAAPPPADGPQGTPAAAATVPASGAPTAAPVPRRAARAAPAPRPLVGPEDRVANLAIRVRQPLDAHLAEVIHAFRREGVRTSKVELIEMLLWELPADPGQVRGRLAAFRTAAPRTTPLSED